MHSRAAVDALSLRHMHALASPLRTAVILCEWAMENLALSLLLVTCTLGTLYPVMVALMPAHTDIVHPVAQVSHVKFRQIFLFAVEYYCLVAVDPVCFHAYETHRSAERKRLVCVAI